MKSGNMASGNGDAVAVAGAAKEAGRRKLRASAQRNRRRPTAPIRRPEMRASRWNPSRPRRPRKAGTGPRRIARAGVAAVAAPIATASRRRRAHEVPRRSRARDSGRGGPSAEPALRTLDCSRRPRCGSGRAMGRRHGGRSGRATGRTTTRTTRSPRLSHRAIPTWEEAIKLRDRPESGSPGEAPQRRTTASRRPPFAAATARRRS